ncbi:MAG TPA: hypothetical protein VGN59_02470 [Acidimicrobiia bacterium]|jgi:hypothetical protein
MASIVSTPRPVPARAAGRPRGFRLRGRAHKLVLTAHILGSVGWFGIAVFVLFAFVVSEATGDRALATGMLRTIETIPWLSIPVGAAAVATGVVLSLGTKWGLVRHWWVVAKILIAIVVIVTDALVISAAAHDHLVHATAPGDLYGPTIAHTVVLGAATLLSVLKPRGRTPWGRDR